MRALLLIVTIAWAAEAHAVQLAVQKVSNARFVPHSEYDYLPAFTNFIEFHNELYFTASIAEGRENKLFKTDGVQITQFDVDPGEHVGLQFVEFKNDLYFRGKADDGIELFRTDGATLTNLDVSPYPEGSWPHDLAVVGDQLYFRGAIFSSYDDITTYLFRTDGAAIERVADVGVVESYPWHDAVGQSLYFPANGSDGFEMFRAEGSTVHQFIDVNPGPESSDPWPAGELNGEFYFTARSAAGRELFKTDGVSTLKLPLPADPDRLGGPVNFFPFGGKLYFGAKGEHGYEMFSTDGHTVTEYDLNPGPASSHPLAYEATRFGDQLVVTAEGPEGWALFVVDGSETRRLDMHPYPADSAPLWFHEFNGELYFAGVGPNGPDLLKTDGFSITEFDVVPDGLENSRVSMYDAVEFEGELYVRAVTANGSELVKTDGVITTMFDVNPGPAGSSPTQLTVFGDQLLFTAFTPTGHAIFSTDGTTVQQLADLNSGSEMHPNYQGIALPSITEFVRFDDQLLFLAKTWEGFYLHRIVAVPEPSTSVVAALLAIVLFARRTNNFA